VVGCELILFAFFLLQLSEAGISYYQL
jgi:hypothetical protein